MTRVLIIPLLSSSGAKDLGEVSDISLLKPYTKKTYEVTGKTARDFVSQMIARKGVEN
jgi:hypothetical protein